MKIKIGIAGSSGELEQANYASLLGYEIANKDCVTVTGAGWGLPYEVVKSAKEAAALTLGISPAISLSEHVESYKFPTEHFDILIFTGFGLKGRNVCFIRSCDAVIIIAGGM